MRGPTRHKNRRARPRLDHVLTVAHTQDSFQHLQCFIIPGMKMQRTDQRGGPGRPARILPLGNNKVASDGTEKGSRQWWRNDRGTHRFSRERRSEVLAESDDLSATSPLPA